jgi:hypothetical protein
LPRLLADDGIQRTDAKIQGLIIVVFEMTSWCRTRTTNISSLYGISGDGKRPLN